MPQNQIFGDVSISGNLSVGSIRLPTGAVSDSSVAAGLPSSAISAQKLIHVIAKEYQQNSNAAVVADNKYAHIVNGGMCSVSAVNAAVDTPATAGQTVSLDLQRSTAGGAFASILSAPLQFSNSNVARVKVTAALSVTTLAQGDILKWVITVGGSGGSQAIGLIAEVILYESAF